LKSPYQGKTALDGEIEKARFAAMKEQVTKLRLAALIQTHSS
jgi:hypothetical protein